MKILIVGDLHIHTFNQYATPEERLQNCINCLEFVYDTAKKHGCEDIIHTGDLFEKHGNLNSLVTDAITLFFKSKQATPESINRDIFDIHFNSISGNHDFATRNRYVEDPSKGYCTATSAQKFLHNSFSSFSLKDGETVIAKDSNNKVTLISFVPYYDYEEDFIFAVQNLLARVSGILEDEDVRTFDNHILVCHQTYVDSNAMIPYELDYRLPLFTDNFNLIINGHIHKPFKDVVEDKMVFLNPGSPIDIYLKDNGPERGIYILDTESMEIELVSTEEHFPKIIAYHGNSIPDRLKGQYVELIPETVTVENRTDVEERYSQDTNSRQAIVRAYLNDLGVGKDPVFAGLVSKVVKE
jgi:DNA repair exonuclease SbcCD nuclease subunit